MYTFAYIIIINNMSDTKTQELIETSPSSDQEQPVINDVEGKVILESWEQMAVYAPKAANEKCSICHNLLTEKCAPCLENSTNIIDTTCKVSMGQCGHAFHSHCIEKWIKDVKVCPIDQSPWIISSPDCSQSEWKKLVMQKKK